MKNNSKILIFFLFCYFFIFQNKIFSDEIIFNTLNIEITNKGNLINAESGSIISTDDNIKINAQSFEYNKTTLELKAINGLAILSEKNIEIKADKFIYDKKLSTLKAIGSVEINDLTNNVTIKSDNVFYQKNSESIQSDVKSTFIDSFNNNITTSYFAYKLNDDLIKISNAKIVSTENEVLYVEEAQVNLLSNLLTGKDVTIDFNNKNFNKENEPRLKGRTVNANNQKTIIEKGIFTTCKKNDDCPPWQFLAKKIVHDKKKKTINYENAWLKIYDKPVFYFPKFFHPDPTVKRQSGFLMPNFKSSISTGTAFSLPYFHAISENRDLTISPRFYSTDKLLAQSEYRSTYAKSTHNIDSSLLSEKNSPSKSHLFLTSFKELDFDIFDDSELSIQLQSVSNDTYLKKYQLKSPLIKDTSTLTSTVGFQAFRDDLSIDTELTVYENLNQQISSDRFQYIYPSYNIGKEFNTPLDKIGSLNLDSSGYVKNYNTNIFEKVMINDFVFSSYPKFTKNGLKNNYNILIKNVNTDSKNSERYEEEIDGKITTLFEFNSSYPLEKKTNKYTNIFKPIISTRYSPSNSKNIRNISRRINVDNIFGIDRIGSSESVEGGASLSFGTHFTKTDFFNREVFNAKIANVLRLKEEPNLPVDSSLGQKTSDIVGSVTYNPNNFFKIEYEFSQDENIKNTNYQLLKNEIKVNNFVTAFEYLNDNNSTEKQSYLSNRTTYSFDKTNNLIFETRQNKKTKAAEFYNLIYQYKNDCLIAAIEYNKDYYSDRDLAPDENIFLKLTIIPFGETKSPNFKYK